MGSQVEYILKCVEVHLLSFFLSLMNFMTRLDQFFCTGSSVTLVGVMVGSEDCTVTLDTFNGKICSS